MRDDVHERGIDDAIDAVARELTADRFDPSFRARVVAGIERRPPPPAWRRPVWILAAAVAIVVAVLVTVTPRHAGRLRNEVARAPASEPRPGQPDHVGAMPPPGAPTVQAADNTRRLPGTRRLARTSAVEMLAPPPLAPESIAVDPIAVPEEAPIESIELSGLTVPPIDVAPLARDDRPETRRPQ